MTGMDDWHEWLAWMTGMEADISHFYILITEGRTDRQTLVLVKSLLQLKTCFWVQKREKLDYFKKPELCGFSETLLDLLIYFVKPKSCSSPLCNRNIDTLT